MAAIKAGMEQWTKNTCIQFKPRTTESSYANFKLGKGCVYIYIYIFIFNQSKAMVKNELKISIWKLHLETESNTKSNP